MSKAADVVRDALLEASMQADIDDVMLNIYLHKHEEWLGLNPEYTQSPYSGIIADLMGQQDFFEKPWAKE